MDTLKKIAMNVEKGDSSAVKELARIALEKNIPAEEILQRGLVNGMESVGRKFKLNEIFIPEVLIATRAMNAGMEIIKPRIMHDAIQKKEKIVIGTVKGDLHDIGKKIVSMVWEREGYHVLDAGIDVSKEDFLAIVKKERPAVLGLSALLTTTMFYMKEIVEAMEKASLRKNLLIVIGGAPVTKLYAKEIRVDGYAPDAESAASLIKNLLKFGKEKSLP